MADSKRLATIEETTIRCQSCRSSHAATLEAVGNHVVGRFRCAHGEGSVRLSSNATLFTKIRAKAASLPSATNLPEVPPLSSLLAVTDHCDWSCPVCYADSGPQRTASYLPLGEIRDRVRRARKLGIRSLTLTGGEPTLHPDLIEIIRWVRSTGLRVLIATNGERLAREEALAGQMKRAGLQKVILQLDALSGDVHERMRGHRRVEEKRKAANHTVKSGLRLGTITTVTSVNIGEIPSVIRFGLSLVPALNTMIFQAAAPVGRFELDEKALVDRERIIDAVLDSEVLPGAAHEDVWPLPHFEPWGMRIHPDCAVHLMLSVRTEQVEPIPRLVDLETLYQRLHRCRSKRSWWARNIVPLIHILRSTRRGARVRLVRDLSTFFTGGRRGGLVIIGMGGFQHPGFLDERRTARCATAELTGDGFVSPCVLRAPRADGQ